MFGLTSAADFDIMDGADSVSVFLDFPFTFLWRIRKFFVFAKASLGK